MKNSFWQAAILATAMIQASGNGERAHAAEASGPERATLLMVPGPLSIDGRILGAEWGAAKALGKLESKEDSFPDTEAWITMDETTIYIAIRCDEPFPEKMRTVTIPDEKKGAVYRDDSVEVFLDVGNNGRSIYHLIANSAGTFYDSQIINMREVPSAWNSGARVRTYLGKKSWEVEMAIPMQSMGHRLVPGEVISVNVGRSRYVEKVNDMPKMASLAGGRFAFPKLFVPLIVGGAIKVGQPTQTGATTFVATKRGPFFPKESGVWEFEVVHSGAEGSALEVLFPMASGEEGKQTFPLKAGRQFVTIPVTPGAAHRLARCVVKLDGREIYGSEYVPQEAVTPEIVAKTENPLFEELLEELPEGLSRESTINWAHEIRPEAMANFSIRTGAEYSVASSIEGYKRDRAVLLVHDPYPIFKGSDARMLIYLRAREAFDKGVPRPPAESGIHNFPWLQDPRSVDVYMKHAERMVAAAKENPNIWGLFAGDETWEINDRVIKWLLDNHRGSYPALDEADAEIKAQYGFGQFGLPESSRDSNPYRWIATRRWEAAKMLSMAQQVRALIDKECPRLKFVSWDNQNGHFPYYLSRWGKVFDIQTGQLYPSKSPDREDIGFNMKWLSDLSGSREVWPCPHVEHYAGNFSPTEVEELLSQVFRNGATGLHIYSADTINNRTGSGASMTDRIGAPERWAVVESVIDRLKTPFRVRQMEPDVAIFYSNTSYQGQPDMMKTMEVEWLYTILGPRLRSAFRFIEDIQLQEPEMDLARYKAIYIPYAPIGDDVEYAALEKYVEQGGTLVVCDPLAFRHRSDGTERTEGRILPPLESAKGGPAQRAQFAIPAKMGGGNIGGELGAFGATYRFALPGAAKGKGSKVAGLQNGKPSTTLGTFEKGGPAIVKVPLGKGKVIFFATNPFEISKVITDSGWRTLFAELQREVGATMENPAWRFRFPATAAYEPKRPAGVCVTGNYFEWSGNYPRAQAQPQRKVGGGYILSRADLHNKEVAGQEVAFSAGLLTDRQKGAEASNNAPAGDHSLTWKSDEPLEITFQLTRPVKTTLARLFFSGALPAGWCETSADGKEWRKGQSWKGRFSSTNVGPWKDAAEAAGHAVALESVELGGAEAAYVRFHFEAAGGEEFTFAEADIWGAE